MPTLSAKKILKEKNVKISHLGKNMKRKPKKSVRIYTKIE